jgi:hypothetical protein
MFLFTFSCLHNLKGLSLEMTFKDVRSIIKGPGFNWNISEPGNCDFALEYAKICVARLSYDLIWSMGFFLVYVEILKSLNKCEAFVAIIGIG